MDQSQSATKPPLAIRPKTAAPAAPQAQPAAMPPARPKPAAPAPAPQAQSAPGAALDPAAETYIQLTRTIERLHRRFLDVVRFEITRLGIHDINAVQALMLTNLEGRELAVRDLVERGYYLGSNVSYNLKQLVEAGYCEQERSERDKRSRRIVLTDKGRALCERLTELEVRHARTLIESSPSKDDPEVALRTLRQLERSWSEYLRYQDV
ncbi:MAG TPA: winged helix DNA-binding protein [Alphaproteobacteria bacterium]